MRIGRGPPRRNFGKHHTTVITLPILKMARAPCTAGESLLMLRWSTYGITLCACRVTLTILRPPPCGATWGLLLKSAHTYVCCKTQCCAPAFGDPAQNGGITPSLTGKNICPVRKRRAQHKLWRLIGKAHCDGGDTQGFAAARIRARLAQSAACLRVAPKLDWTDHRIFPEKPPRPNCDISPRTYQRRIRVAGL